MENASKALIIAGAILLSILIIALGIYVFNMAKNASSTSSLDELEVSQFNQEFTMYRGNQLGSGVVQLIDKVVANASANKDADERLPDIIYLDNRAAGKGPTGWGTLGTSGAGFDAASSAGLCTTSATACMVVSNSTNPNLTAIGNLRGIMAEKHTYKVAFNTNGETGLIDFIMVQY